MIQDADAFLNRWSEHAHALGWTTLDLFGADRTKPYARIDCAGLVLLVNGAAVVEMTEREAIIRVAGGRTNGFTVRAVLPEQVPAWELADRGLSR